MNDLAAVLLLFPTSFLGLVPLRFALTPRPEKRYTAIFYGYLAVIMLCKTFFDYYRTVYAEYTFLSYSFSIILSLSLPIIMLLCFQDNWRWRTGIILPHVFLQSLLVFPSYMLYARLKAPLVWKTFLPLPLLMTLNILVAFLLMVFLLRRLRPMFEKLPLPLRTIIGLASPLAYLLMNLQQLVVLLYYGSTTNEAAVLSCLGIPYGAVVLLLFFWLARRQTEQELGYTAAREQMHQRAILAQRDNLERLQKMRRVQRERLLHIRALLEQGQPGLALADLQSMTFQPGGAVRRYADNPVADVALADADRQCRLAGLELRIDGTLPRQCPLPPADLASLLYNLLSNAVEAARTAQKPAAVEVHFTTAAGRLCVTVCNPVGPRSSPRGPDHGFGLRILREITARHDGSYTLDIRSGRATARAMLCLPAGKGGERHV